MKVLFTDDTGEPVMKATQQVAEDPFEGSRYAQGLVEPRINLQQLVHLAETHPVHSAALEQKTADVIGTGWSWEPAADGAPDNQREELETWLDGLAGDERTVHEILTQSWSDVEKLNVGYIEVARDPSGKVRSIFHVPGQTVRFHKDGLRLAQVRNNKRVWFGRWGALPEGSYVNKKTGTVQVDVDPALRANELLVLRRNVNGGPYGMPSYVSAIGWITLAVAVRDDNLYFFSNRREPRWAIVITNIEENDDIEEDLRQALTVDLQQPHRNIILPIEGAGKVDFQQLSTMGGNDGSFENLDARCDARILVAHRIPPERLGMNRVGPLGGNVAMASSRVYREAVISTSQALLATRINRFIETEYPKRNQAVKP